MTRLSTIARSGCAALGVAAFVGASSGRAETVSTTSVGYASRTITYTPKKIAELPTAGQGGGDDTLSEEVTESLIDPILCQRISAAMRIGTEVAAGGCAQYGGLNTFMHSISAYGQLQWHPLATLGSIGEDDAVRIRRRLESDVFLAAQGGFAKISHAQSEVTTYTYSMDIIEVGFGAGYLRRIGPELAVGVEAFVLGGLVVSNAAKGSTTQLQGAVTLAMNL